MDGVGETVAKGQQSAPSSGLAVQAGEDVKSTTGEPLTNGDTNHSAVNGLSEKGPVINGDVNLSKVNSDDIGSLLVGAPPELEHWDQGFIPLGDLIAKVAQECFNDLTALIDDLAEMPVPIHSGAGLSNGHSGSNPADDARDDTPINRQKKLRLLEFAQSSREKFIMMLVLLRWSKEMPNLRKLIDLLLHLRKTSQYYDQVLEYMADIKKQMQPFKIPPPNISHAAEVLSRQTASWMGQFDNYVPQKPLTPAETLKILRKLNSELNIRLITHEDLPIHLRNYRLGDGRATFVFPQEFEVAVTIASEDYTKPFYFVDFRFLFDPTSELKDGPIRNQIENHTNTLLVQGGLVLVTEWLLSFTLNHKITTLRQQAETLARAEWSQVLRIDQIHQSLIIKYWVDSPMPASWIELGMHSGKRGVSGEKVAQNAARRRIGSRWTRAGQKLPETESPPLELHLLSAENLLKRLIARHINFILLSIRDGLIHSTSSDTAFEVKLKESLTEPVDCSLRMRLGPASPEVVLSMEPTTGRFFMQPTSRLSSTCLDALNKLKNPAKEAAANLAQYLSNEIIGDVKRHLLPMRCSLISNQGLTALAIKSKTKEDALAWCFYKPKAWANKSPWAAAAVANLQGLTWWYVELKTTSTGDSIIDQANRLPVPQMALSRAYLDEVDRSGVFSLTCRLAVQELHRHNIDTFVVDKLSSRRANTVQLSTPRASETASGTASCNVIRQKRSFMGIRVSKLVPELSGTSSLFGDFALLQFSLCNMDQGFVQMRLLGVMRQHTDANAQLAKISDNSLQIREDGAFAIDLGANLRRPFIGDLRSNLRALGKLGALVTGLSRHSLTIETLSLAKVTFAYPGDMALSTKHDQNCTIILPSSSDTSTFDSQSQLTQLEFPSTNPHRHIQPILQEYLNTNSKLGFSNFIGALAITLPLCNIINTFESSPHYTPRNPSLHCHRTDVWKMTYTNPPCAFQIVLRHYRDKLQWQILDLSALGGQSGHEPFTRNPDGTDRAPALVKALQTFFAAGRSESNWRAYKTLIVADNGQGLVSIMTQLDWLLREFREQIGTGEGAKGDPSAGAGARAKTEVITLD